MPTWWFTYCRGHGVKRQPAESHGHWQMRVRRKQRKIARRNERVRRG